MKSIRQAFWGILVAWLFLCIIFGSLATAMVESHTAAGLFLSATPSPASDDTPLTILPGSRNTPQPSLTATQSGVCPTPPGWQPITVQPADTLEQLAQTYGTTVDALLQANCLVSPKLIPGTQIRVPAIPTPLPAVSNPTATVSLPATPCGRPPGWIIYTVQAGDNLYRLGLAFNISVYQLIQANCLPTTTIYTGQQLYVPNVPTQTPVHSPTATVTFTPPATSTPTPTLPIVTTPALPTVVTATLTPTETLPTPTATATDEPTPTETPTPTASPTPTATSTPTLAPYPR